MAYSNGCHQDSPILGLDDSSGRLRTFGACSLHWHTCYCQCASDHRSETCRFTFRGAEQKGSYGATVTEAFICCSTVLVKRCCRCAGVYMCSRVPSCMHARMLSDIVLGFPAFLLSCLKIRATNEETPQDAVSPYSPRNLFGDMLI